MRALEKHEIRDAWGREHEKVEEEGRGAVTGERGEKRKRKKRRNK
jgi:hypothetical protein